MTAAGAIAPIDPASAPAPTRGSVMLVAAQQETAVWLAATAAVPQLVQLTRTSYETETQRVQGIAAGLGAASIARAGMAPGVGLDAIAPTMSGPAPWITTGQGLPGHPGTGGNVVPAAGLDAYITSYVNTLIQQVLNLLGGAPLV